MHRFTVKSVGILVHAMFLGCTASPSPEGPELDHVHPDQGYNDNSTQVTINGDGLAPLVYRNLSSCGLDNSIRVDDTFEATLVNVEITPETFALTEVTWVDDSRLQGTIPAEMFPGLYDLEVVLPNGDLVTLEDAYRVVTGLEWVTVPAGSFWMGSPDGTCPSGYTESCPSELERRSDETLHYVTLTGSFELMRYELTQGQFAVLMEGWNPSEFGPNGTWGECGLDCPVENVSWYDAVAYANALSLNQGKTRCYSLTDIACSDGTNVGSDAAGCMNTIQRGIASATVGLNGVKSVYDCKGYRLPTESEWEYAIRAGADTAFYNGDITVKSWEPLDTNLDAIGWYGGNSSFEAYSTYDCTSWYTGASTCGPQPVGGKGSNRWGLHDLSGNVWEWVWDWYDLYPSGTMLSPLLDPEGPASASDRVRRGGCWENWAKLCRSAYRNIDTPDYRNLKIGFRLSRSK